MAKRILCRRCGSSNVAMRALNSYYALYFVNRFLAKGDDLYNHFVEDTKSAEEEKGFRLVCLDCGNTSDEVYDYTCTYDDVDALIELVKEDPNVNPYFAVVDDED